MAISRTGRMLRRPWYKLWQILQDRAYFGHEYTLSVPYGQRVLTPWFDGTADKPFAMAMRTARSAGQVDVSADRCFVLFHLSSEAIRKWPDAAIAECGVYNGGTAEIVSQSIAPRRSDRNVFHLFDSFVGMPPSSEPERDYHSPGDFSDTSLAGVKARLARFPFCRFHAGFMPETFTEVADVAEYSFVHVDVDIYQSVKDCLAWFWPRLIPGGVIVFDDYGFYPYRRAARAAVDEYFGDISESPWILPTGQAVVFKDG